jgi:hypothetical protein
VTPPAGKGCLPWGALDGLTKLRASKTLRSSVYSDYTGDPSRADELTRPLTSALEGAWRTPTLRNVALTGPYMHDGIYGTLQEVVAHYNRGGEAGAPGVRAVQIRPLGLTDGEQADLVAFLQTLTETVAPAGGTAGAGGAGAASGFGGPPGTGGVSGAGAATGGGLSGVRDAGTSPRDAGAVGRDAGPGNPDANQPRPVCRGVLPATTRITESAVSPVGSVYAFAAPGVSVPVVTSQSSTPPIQPGVQVLWAPDPMGNPPPASAGFGLSFAKPACVDARVFSGVTFTVTGSLGTCALQFGVVPSEDNPVTSSPYGSCGPGANCVAPLSGPIGLGTTVVRFSEMTGGSPLATPDLAALNAVQWVLTQPTGGAGAGCTASITVSHVEFVVDDGDSTPPICPPEPAPCDEGTTCVFPNVTMPGGCVERLSCVAGGWLPRPCAL